MGEKKKKNMKKQNALTVPIDRSVWYFSNRR